MFKVGFSKDIHKLKSGKGFMLGSFFIECKKTVDAYSDGDVIWHSLTEALLGAMGLEDLGTYYKPEFYVRGFDSIIMIKETLEKLKKRNYRISNIDITIQLDEPSLKATKKLIKQNIAKILEISENDISLKATTSEGTLLNSIVCYSSVLIYKEEKKNEKI